MVEELVETIVPGGAWLAVGVGLGAAFGERLRPLAKSALKVGMDVFDRAQVVGAEAVERGQDLVAEARHEREEERAAPARRRARRTTAADTPKEK
jgi:diketogulonate reductase-like aldo/keto reductase